MKLLVTIVQSADAGDLIDALVQRGFRATRINTAGGFLKEGNSTILLGVKEAQVDDVLAIIQANCRTRTQLVTPVAPAMEAGDFWPLEPIEVQIGGATIFVLDVDQVVHL